MEFAVLLLIATGLSFDTFAVSITIGLTVNQIRFREATKLAVVLALFQALMPAIGWLIGTQISELLSLYDYWIAFGLLSIIGLKMIIESLKKEEKRKEFDPFKPFVLIGLAVATSIDALIAGVSFAFIDINILLAVAAIGFTTYLAAMLGMLFGKKAGKHLGEKMEMAGGLILIAIGVKLLLEHLYT